MQNYLQGQSLWHVVKNPNADHQASNSNQSTNQNRTELNTTPDLEL
ncbi:hypothetical protein A2U01_0077273, partial [Trifolium medium]|nr:hypothetical protein [Trifolium medium]